MLGTTPEGLDIGIPGRLDMHLQMPLAPRVAIAESASLRDVLPNARVAIAMRGSGAAAHAFAMLVIEGGVRAFDDGEHPWDFPGGNGRLVVGRVARRIDRDGSLVLTVRSGGRSSLVSVSSRTSVLALRPASRDALISPQSAFVFATPPDGGLYDVVESVIVANGDVALPL